MFLGVLVYLALIFSRFLLISVLYFQSFLWL